MSPMYQKYLLFFQYILLLIGILFGHHVLAVLEAGDIAFVQYNADGKDDKDNFAFVALVDIAENEQLFFTDKGWKADNSWRTGEGLISWTADSEISAGTVITITDNSASMGTVSGAGLEFSTLGDQLIAYQETDTMIAALNNEGSVIWQADATNTNTSTLPEGLTNGVHAVALAEKDNVYYAGVTVGEKANLLAALNNSHNWTGNNTHTVSFSDTFIITTGKTYAEPSHHPTSLIATAVTYTNSQITLSWLDAAAGDQAPFGYLILCNTTDVFTTPVDGDSFPEDTECQDGQGAVKVFHNTGGRYTWRGLNAETTYFFKIFPYSNIDEKIDYKTDENPIISTTKTHKGAWVINEIYADPDTVAGDSNADGVIDNSDDEFIELVNNTGQSVDISGWTLSDSVGIKHQFPIGTIINHQCGVVVFAGGESVGQFGEMTVQMASSDNLGLNNNGDTVTLKNGEVVIDQVSYNSIAADNQSLTRDPDIVGQFVKHTETTSAQLFSVGTQQSGIKFSGCQPADITVTETQNTTTVSESGTTDHFNVVLDKRPNTPIELSILNDISHVTTVTPSILIFTPADWHITQQVSVTGLDDGVKDTGDHHGTMTLSINKKNSDAMYHFVSDKTVNVTVTDNDEPPPPPPVITIPQPNTPTDLTAEITNNEVVLTWIDHSGIEQGYHLYRDNVLFETLTSQNGSHKTITFHDKTVNLACGSEAIKYTYHVGAFNSVGEAKTEVASVSIAACPPPPIPVINTGLIRFTKSELSIYENIMDNILHLQLERIGGSEQNITAYLHTVDKEAEIGNDYHHPSSTKLTWEAGETQPKVITIPIVNDSEIEENESFNIVLSGEQIDRQNNTIQITILNDDHLTPTPLPPSPPNNQAIIIKDDSPTIRNCKISGKTLTGSCDHQYQALIADLQLMPYSSLSRVSIPTGITVQGDKEKTGIISHSFIEYGGLVNHTSLSGDTIIHGQADTVSFVGHVLDGENKGSLVGYTQHNSQIGGSIRNIRLAHQAVIDGRKGKNPKVGGLIIGHSSGTSRLEHVIIEEGATIVCVQLGKQVQRPQTMHYIACDLLNNLNSESIDINGQLLPSNADFSGDITFTPQNNEEPLAHITTRFRVDLHHIGEEADILIYAQYIKGDISSYYMLTGNGVEVWDGELATLIPFKNKETLTYLYDIDIFKGVLTSGILTIYISYHLKNGLLVYATLPIVVEMTSP